MAEKTLIQKLEMWRAKADLAQSIALYPTFDMPGNLSEAAGAVIRAQTHLVKLIDSRIDEETRRQRRTET